MPPLDPALARRSLRWAIAFGFAVGAVVVIAWPL